MVTIHFLPLFQASDAALYNGQNWSWSTTLKNLKVKVSDRAQKNIRNTLDMRPVKSSERVAVRYGLGTGDDDIVM